MDVVMTIDGDRLRIGIDGVIRSDSEPAQSVEPAEIRQCKLWLDRAEATRAGGVGVNSFWLRHVIQHWAGTPISNGAVILAAFQKGFAIYRKSDEASANVHIGVAIHCIDEFDCGCGHP